LEVKRLNIITIEEDSLEDSIREVDIKEEINN
jgi:hypothetical protein